MSLERDVAPLADAARRLDAAALPLACEPQPCGYLAGRVARHEGRLAFRLAPALYEELLERNYRRSGRIVYRPACEACTACRQMRVPVADFRPTREQRRCRQRNADVEVVVRSRPVLSREKHDLYLRYMEAQHPASQQGTDVTTLREFLYSTCVDTGEIEYRDPHGRLLAVSIVDLCPRALSSVYHFFDPDEHRRSLGTFSVLAEIELCREWRRDWYYLGYVVAEAPTMAYKAHFRPHEVLVAGEWQRVG